MWNGKNEINFTYKKFTNQCSTFLLSRVKEMEAGLTATTESSGQNVDNFMNLIKENKEIIISLNVRELRCLCDGQNWKDY